jgi:heat-inducible transcriptional repressor
MADVELSDRKRQILKAIVEAHIAEGEPVGSKYIVENRQLACSSATIRNEMSELEEMGYLEKPHTSAGRVPSELGYRFYVDSLVQHYAMTANEIAEINNILKSKMNELDQILENATRLASNITNYTGFAVKPRYSTQTITKFEAISIDSFNLLLVMILTGGVVKTKKIRMSAAINDEFITKLNGGLNRHLAGLSSQDITLPILMNVEDELGIDAPLIGPIIKAIYDTMNESETGDLRISGLNRLLQYPEFSDSQKFAQLLNAIESKDEILNLVSQGESHDDVSVIIGSESSVNVMNNSSVIYKPIKKDGRTVGAIGVIGPLRMDYAKVLATIEELSDNISNIIDTDKKRLTEGDTNSGK